MNQNENFQQVNFAELEAKSRFASFFPKDLKYLIKLVQEVQVTGEDAEPISGYSEQLMMKERVLIKLDAYLALFNGADPEEMDPGYIQHHMPPEFKEKYYEQMQKYMPKKWY